MAIRCVLIGVGPRALRTRLLVPVGTETMTLIDRIRESAEENRR